MTHHWKQTITINENIARKLIETQNHVMINTIRFLDEGWDNCVYLINEKFVFRFPRREASVILMENEIALLPYIAKHLSFPVSHPSYVGLASTLYPYPFSGYAIIPGKPLCDAASTLITDMNFAKTLAAWLKELHSIKVTDEYVGLIKGDHAWRLHVQHRISRCEENIAHYEKYFLQAGFETHVLRDVIAFLSNLQFKELKKVYLHGDLYSRHIIVYPDRLLPSGIIDWGDLHSGHPGIDLAIGMIFTEETFKLFLNAYGDIDTETIHVMLFHAFCHSISLLPYAYEKNNAPLKQWTSLTLKRAINEIKKL